MVDILSPGAKRRNEPHSREGHTAELLVRRAVFAMGYRYQLHVTELPGRPDLVFPGRRKVIFVHGCFWHRRPGCPFAYRPKSREAFWDSKLARNRERDQINLAQLTALRWRALVIWECELGAIENVRNEIALFG